MLYTLNQTFYLRSNYIIHNKILVTIVRSNYIWLHLSLSWYRVRYSIKNHLRAFAKGTDDLQIHLSPYTLTPEQIKLI